MTFVDDLAAANPVRDETPYGDARAAALIADITAGRVTAPPPPPAPTRRPWLVCRRPRETARRRPRSCPLADVRTAH
jgi:hypothetical protein